MVTNSLQCKLCCLEKNVARMFESYLKRFFVFSNGKTIAKLQLRTL